MNITSNTGFVKITVSYGVKKHPTLMSASLLSANLYKITYCVELVCETCGLNICRCRHRRFDAWINKIMQIVTVCPSSEGVLVDVSRDLLVCEIQSHYTAWTDIKRYNIQRYNYRVWLNKLVCRGSCRRAQVSDNCRIRLEHFTDKNYSRPTRLSVILGVGSAHRFQTTTESA